jgi:DNA repair protein RadC
MKVRCIDERGSKIRDLPRVDRPREKLIELGREALSNTELLAIIIGSGTKEENAISIARRLLKKYGNRNLVGLSREELAKNPGIGKVRSCQLVAAFELSGRLSGEKEEADDSIGCPQDVYNLTKSIRNLKKEHFVAVYLNAKNRMIKKETVSIGTLNSSLVHPREVFQPAVALFAASIILVHNHPSGDLEPSEEDVSLTRRLIEAGRIMGIDILDHVIIGSGGFLSMKERNLM